jgi:hypothetical protein
VINGGIRVGGWWVYDIRRSQKSPTHFRTFTQMRVRFVPGYYYGWMDGWFGLSRTRHEGELSPRVKV